MVVCLHGLLCDEGGMRNSCLVLCMCVHVSCLGPLCYAGTGTMTGQPVLMPSCLTLYCPAYTMFSKRLDGFKQYALKLCFLNPAAP